MGDKTLGKSWRDQLSTETRTSTEADGAISTERVPGLTILAHPDTNRVGEVAVLPGLVGGRAEELSRLSPRFAPTDGGEARPLAEARISRQPIVLKPKGQSVLLEPGGTRTRLLVNGEVVRDAVVVEPDEDVVLVLAARVALVLHLMDPRVVDLPHYGMIGESMALAAVRRDIARVADLPYAVLLRGESGTGKELVARALHDAGPRRAGPFLSVNMAAIPPALATAELFGASRGAFTGAGAGHPGYFERANGGTLFLDEIGATPPEIQPLLLRALENGELQPVGGTAPRKVDVRVVSATDSDLSASSVGFHSPLLHRLAAYEIELPPLRQRRADVGRLFFHFLRQELLTVGEPERLEQAGWVPAGLVARLALYRWPGNVRQLRNVARQVAVASRGAEVLELPERLEKLLLEKLPRSKLPKSQPPTQASFREPSDVSVEELRAVLASCDWEVKPAAAALGVSRGSLYNLMERHGIRRASQLERDEILAVLDDREDLAAAASRLEVSQRGLRLRWRELQGSSPDS